MSFDINWENLVADGSLNDTIREFLDSQFQSITLPSFIDNLSVTKFDLGNCAPEIIIRHIGDPFDDFYEDSEEEGENVRVSAQGTPVDYNSSEDEEDTEDEEEEQTIDLSMISEETNLLSFEKKFRRKKSSPPPPPQTPPLANSNRKSLDSVSLLFQKNNLNYSYNYSMNNIVGLGNLNNPNSHIDRDTPSNILNQNPLRQNSTAYLKNKISSRERCASRGENDLQMIVEINYNGDLQLEVTVNLLLNYPSPKFISLPIKLHVTALKIHSIAAIAYLKKSVYFSFLCDIDDKNSDYFSSAAPSTNGTTPTGKASVDGNFVDYVAGPNNRERIDIIKKVRIESEIGEVENNILRNVGKVEKFIVDQLRSIVRDEVAWPSWVCFDMNEDDQSDPESNSQSDS